MGVSIALPLGDYGVGLHGVVILGGRLINRLDRLGGAGKLGFDVAGLGARRIAGPDDFGCKRLALEAGARALRIIGRGEQAGPLRRRLEGLGDDHCDRLAGIADPVVLQEVHAEHEGVRLLVRIACQRRTIARRHHLDDARMGLGSRDIHMGDASARDRGDGEDGVEKAVGVVVGGIARAAGHLEEAIAPGERLADIGAVALMRTGGQGWGLRHGRHRWLLRRTGARKERREGPAFLSACRRLQG